MSERSLPGSMHVTTRFTATREALVAAIAVASTVPAQPLSCQSGSRGALFVVPCTEGRTTGAIYCRSSSMVSRGLFPLGEVMREGRFVFSTRHLSIFERLPAGDRVTVEAATDGDEYRVRFVTRSGTRYDYRYRAEAPF